MHTITAGMIKIYEECPEKFNLIYKKHLDIPTNDKYTEIGKMFHVLANYKIKGFDISKTEKILEKPQNKELQVLWNNFSLINEKSFIESEYTFNIPLTEEIRLTGRTDAIRKIDDKYEICDWKTGKSENVNADSDWQTIFYLYGIYELFKYRKKIKNYDDLCMTYYFLKENQQVTISLSEEKYLEYKEKLILICNKILSDNSKISIKNEKCYECSYKIICNRALSMETHVL